MDARKSRAQKANGTLAPTEGDGAQSSTTHITPEVETHVLPPEHGQLLLMPQIQWQTTHPVTGGQALSDLLEPAAIPTSPQEHLDDTESPTKGLSGDLPPVDFPPPPAAPERPPPVNRTPSEGLGRKMTSPFSWLSRATNRQKAPASPGKTSGTFGVASRRGTASSVATLGSNPDNMLGTINDEHDRGLSPRRPHANSLQDRFHALRLQEEGDLAGEHMTQDTENALQSPRSPHGEVTSPPPMTRTASGSKVPTVVDSKLAPGTAAGISVGPSAGDEEPVNWDLWQTVVYEGPAAVARTSGEELSKAIQGGIPQPIRGVVWQVLAQSKNEDLEAMYRELVARGTDQAYLKSPPLSRSDSTQAPNGAAERESLTSSASSVHSQASTPATSNVAGSPIPTSGETTNDTIAKVQDTLAANHRQGLYDDPKALAKLEKMIKRDLGTRTSFSKYLASAGLQDGLFGICKAYALYDEVIGYAQGMNFIAMPLLFNVSVKQVIPQGR